MANCYYTVMERRLVCDGKIIEAGKNPSDDPEIVKKMIAEAKRTGVYDQVVKWCLKQYPDSDLDKIGASINMPIEKRREILQKWRDNCIRNRLRFVTRVCEYKLVPVKYPCEKKYPSPHNIDNPPHKKKPLPPQPHPKPKPKPIPEPKPRPTPNPQPQPRTSSFTDSLKNLDTKTKAGLAAAGVLIALYALAG